MIALIVGVIIYLLISQTNVSVQQQETEDLEQVSENYVSEANRLLNTLQGSKPDDIIDVISDFTDIFVYSYARPTDPEFGLFFILHNKEKKIEIENYLGTVVMIEDKLGDVKLELQPSDVVCLDAGVCIGPFCSEKTITSRLCKEIYTDEEYKDLSDLVYDVSRYRLEYRTQDLQNVQLNVETLKQNDKIVVVVDDPETDDGIAYYFTVGDEVELSAITRRTEEGVVEIYQSE